MKGERGGGGRVPNLEAEGRQIRAEERLRQPRPAELAAESTRQAGHQGERVRKKKQFRIRAPVRSRIAPPGACKPREIRRPRASSPLSIATTTAAPCRQPGRGPSSSGRPWSATDTQPRHGQQLLRQTHALLHRRPTDRFCRSYRQGSHDLSALLRGTARRAGIINVDVGPTALARRATCRATGRAGPARVRAHRGPEGEQRMVRLLSCFPSCRSSASPGVQSGSGWGGVGVHGSGGAAGTASNARLCDGQLGAGPRSTRARGLVVPVSETRRCTRTRTTGPRARC